MNDHIITIVIPTYNRIELLQKAYNSCKMQTNTNFDLIIVDNASDDGSQNFLSSIYAQDKIISELILNPTNLGATFSITNALNKVKTPWVTIVCDDDTIEPNFIEKILPIISNTKTGFVITGFNVVNENDDLLFSYNMKDQILNKNELIIKFLNGNIQTAGLSGFLFLKEAISEPKNYPKGFLSDTMICVEAGLYNGAEIISDCLYNRLVWSGAESNFSVENTKNYLESLLLFGKDLELLLSLHQLSPIIYNSINRSQSLKHFFRIIILPIFAKSFLTFKDIKDFYTIINHHNHKYFLHFIFLIILYPFTSIHTSKIRYKLFKLLRQYRKNANA